MADEGTQGVGEQGNQQAAGGAQQGASGQQGGQGQEQTPGPVPYDRFKAVNEELGTLKAWKAEQERAAEQARRERETEEAKRLAEQGQFKSLAEQREAQLKELEPFKQKAEALEAVVKAIYEKRLEELPAAARKAVEGLPGLSVEQRLAWLNENASLLAKPAAPNINGTEQGGKQPALNEAEAAELAAVYGVNPKYLVR